MEGQPMNKKTLTRTPREAVSLPKVSGKNRNPRQSVIYQKDVNLRVTGSDPEKIQATIAEIHKIAGGTQRVIGGKTKRVVDICAMTSKDKPKKIFDGLIE